MGVTRTTDARQERVLAYLMDLTAAHSGLDGYDIVLIVGVVPATSDGEVHLIEVDRNAFPSEEGRLYPIALNSTRPEAGEFIWLSMVTPEELRQVIEHEDRSLLDILRDSRIELIYPEPEELSGSEVEALWEGIRRVGRAASAPAADA